MFQIKVVGIKDFCQKKKKLSVRFQRYIKKYKLLTNNSYFSKLNFLKQLNCKINIILIFYLLTTQNVPFLTVLFVSNKNCSESSFREKK